MIAFEIIIFSLTLWLGLYLISRDLANVRLRLAGLGLVAYALGLSFDFLGIYAADPTPTLAHLLASLRWPLLFLPALCWVGSAIYSLPEEMLLRPRLIRLWQYGLLPLSLAFYSLGLATDLLFTGTPKPLPTGFGYLAFGLIVVLPLFLLLVLLVRWLQTTRPAKLNRVLVVTLFFFLFSTGAIVLPAEWLSRYITLGLLGFDLLLLGVVIAVLDAFEQGEAFLPDALRSFSFSAASAGLFGGQVGLAMALATGPTFAMLVLLVATVATAILTQTFASQLQSLLDRLALAAFPRLRRARAELRAAGDALPRINDTLDPLGLDEAEFGRLTRRALSNFGDLTRLATNPLTHLPVVGLRLSERGAKDDPLERAVELKALLTESIERLKPRNKGDFGTSDEWRHYNALNWPYLAGLKPYSLRAQHDNLDGAARQALEWFRASVPERTLYNWQSAAARLVAQDLRSYSFALKA